MAPDDVADVVLDRLVVDARLLDRAYPDYAWRTALAFGILASGVLLATTSSVASAVLIAVGCVQVALIGHDAGHKAVFEHDAANYFLATVCWTAVNCVSFAYWNDRHSRHHACPNDTNLDPDVGWAFGALLTPLLAFTLRLEGWRYAIAHKQKTELMLMSLSALAHCVPLSLFGWSWLTTFAMSQVLASLYLAIVVAPNHIGMPRWESEGSFLQRQLRSTRNVLPHPVVDLIFGGLNYQIEHHLFPTMPRSHLSAARRIIKPFCAERGLPYTECSIPTVGRAVLAELPRLARQV